MYVSLFLIMLLIVRLATQDTITSTAQGTLRGLAGESHVSYMGIPYASLNHTATKFKRAGPAPGWTGIRDAQRRAASCHTSDEEDCLQLDVHVPFGSSPVAWPVMVWIPGGPAKYDPTNIVKRGLIFITVHYRSGPLGFLCLRNDEIPGNAGAKDVVLALRWVRDNIVAFRGDPAKVTLAGHGFAAALTEALVISPMASNLFHGAIIQSGSVLSPWAFNYDAEKRAKALAKRFTENSDNKSIVNKLMKTKAADLIEEAAKLKFPYFPFAICPEKPNKKEELFLSEPPIAMLKTQNWNNIPIMSGYSVNEAYIFISNLKKAKVLRRLRKGIAFLLPDELIFRTEEDVREVSRQIKDAYFSDNITLTGLLAYHRDAYFVSHTHRSVRLLAARNEAKLYYYQFLHSGALGVRSHGDVHKNGAAHSDELAYLFPENGKTLDGDDGAVQDRLLTLWSNFVKHLDPTPQPSDALRWEPMNAKQPRVYNIAVDVEMQEFPYSQTTNIWDTIYERYYYKMHEGIQL